jgi:hypothetical protein
MAVVLKTTEPGRVPGVRIPLSPPAKRYKYLIFIKLLNDVAAVPSLLPTNQRGFAGQRRLVTRSVFSAFLVGDSSGSASGRGRRRLAFRR